MMWINDFGIDYSYTDFNSCRMKRTKIQIREICVNQRITTTNGPLHGVLFNGVIFTSILGDPDSPGKFLVADTRFNMIFI